MHRQLSRAVMVLPIGGTSRRRDRPPLAATYRAAVMSTWAPWVRSVCSVRNLLTAATIRRNPHDHQPWI